MTPQLLIVHHKPGRDEGYQIAEAHARSLAKMLGLPVTPLTIEEFLRTKQAPKEARVVAYLLLRGDHYDEVLEKTRELGLPFLGAIPLSLTARALCRWAHERGCGGRVRVLYYPARRNVERQKDDLMELARLVREECGAEVVFERASHGKGRNSDALGGGISGLGDCVVTLALFPVARGEGFLLRFVEKELVEWLRGRLGLLDGVDEAYQVEEHAQHQDAAEDQPHVGGSPHLGGQ